MSNEIQQTPSKTENLTAPPAYFLSMTVENFRCFGSAQTLDLSDGEGHPIPWTIILGENGVGKTTLLQCLTPLLYYFSTIANDLRTFNTISGSGLKLKQRNADVFYEVSYGAPLQNTDSEKMSYHFRFTVRQDGGSYSGPAVNLQGLNCYGYGASRRMGKSTLSEQRTEDTMASLFVDDADLINAEEWLLQADYAATRAQGDSIAAHRRDQVKQILIDLLPDATDLRIDAPKGSLGTAAVEFETPYGWVPLKGLSLGYRTLITWMVDLASRLFDRYPNSPNPLAEPAVVLVDEIDLHLHPRWQRTLMQFLSDKFPNAQFIATAHSPLVVQAATDANIVLLRREGDHVVIDNNVETIKNWRVDQILTSDLFGLESARPPQIDDALAERAKILSKSRLTQADQKRLTELEAQIGRLPTGETPEDMQAMDIIRRAAELLKTE